MSASEQARGIHGAARRRGQSRSGRSARSPPSWSWYCGPKTRANSSRTSASRSDCVETQQAAIRAAAHDRAALRGATGVASQVASSSRPSMRSCAQIVRDRQMPSRPGTVCSSSHGRQSPMCSGDCGEAQQPFEIAADRRVAERRSPRPASSGRYRSERISVRRRMAVSYRTHEVHSATPGRHQSHPALRRGLHRRSANRKFAAAASSVPTRSTPWAPRIGR